jgi:glycosyltransferase involved in cell wall biosynthesis
LRIVQANAVYDPALRTPEALLDAYHTLTEWSAAVAEAGATVAVVQRFGAEARVERDGIFYHFTADREPPWLSTSVAPTPFVRAVAGFAPDVVHVNGLIFPAVVAAIRKELGPRVTIVAQHHGGEFPIRGSGIFGAFNRMKWRSGLASADALSFTAADQAEPWRAAGLLTSQRILEIVEASTTLRHVSRERASTALGLYGRPLILWVGRLTTNKDPLTVLDGLERALPRLPDAHVIMVFGDDTLVEPVEDRIRSSAVLQPRVTLAGRVPREELPNYYAAADVFVSGSHSEGSGYAMIEAMAAGVVPVVTDIPSFRVIAGEQGAQCPAGDAAAFSDALLRVCGSDWSAGRAEVKAHFERKLSWAAIAERTVSEYRSLVEAKRA